VTSPANYCARTGLAVNPLRYAN